MKTWACILTVLFIFAAALAAYFYVGGSLLVDVSVETVRASEYDNAYETVTASVKNGTAHTVFVNSLPASANDCVLVRVKLDMRNIGMFDAEWLTVETLGGARDIAVYEVVGEEQDIPRFGSGSAEVRILAGGNCARTIKLTYYVLGVERTVTVAVLD